LSGHERGVAGVCHEKKITRHTRIPKKSSGKSQAKGFRKKKRSKNIEESFGASGEKQ